MRIEIDRDDLRAAADAGLLERADALWDFLSARVAADGSVRVSPSGVVEAKPRSGPIGRLSLVHVLWFAGALLVLGAMSFFATLGFEAFGGGGLAVIAAIYASVFLAVGMRLWRDPSMKVMGGLLVTLAVGMVPLFTFGAQKALGIWVGDDPGSYRDFTRWIRGGWFFMEVTTVAASIAALRAVRFPFLVVVPSVALWFMSMDIVHLSSSSPTQEMRGWVSVLFGAAMLATGFMMRRRGIGDLAFWLDTFGLIALQGGLLSQRSDAVWSKLGFVLVQIGLLEVGRRQRRSFHVVVATVGLGALLFSSHNFAGRLSLGYGAALLLFAYGYAARRVGPSRASLVSLLMGSLFVLALPWKLLDDTAVGFLLYGATATGVVLLGVPARSRVLVASGGLGITLLLGRLAFDVFADSMVFPLVVASLGIGIMVLGYFIHKHSAALDAFLESRLPPWFQALRVPRD
jgi:hypothetical protein